MKLRVIRGLLVFLAMALVATPVLAFLYQAPVTVSEGSGNSYTQLPIIVSMNNDWLASNGFMDANALDTRVQTLAGSDRAWMIADDKTLFATSVPSNSQTNLYFVTGEASAADMDIITGYNGYITTADAAALELGNNFDVEIDGYFNTSLGAGYYLDKEGAVEIYNSAATDITADILTTATTYAQVQSTSQGVDNTDQTSHTVALPAGIVAGDLIIVIFSADGLVVGDSIQFPTGWTELYDSSFAAVSGAAAYKIAEDNEDASITVTTTNAEKTTYIAYRIDNYYGIPEVGTAATGNSANPDPPNLAPSWGAATTLWIAVEHSDGNVTVTAVPAGYGGGLDQPSGAGDGSCTGTAQLDNNAAAENPGQYTISGAQEWVSNTIAIQPAYDVQKSITANGVASGEHTVRVYADGVDFKIDVDTVNEDSVALAGVSVPDTAFDYIWQSTIGDISLLPYIDYITMDVGGVEVINYNPIAIISGTTLPDRTGAAQNGVITWGSNPAGVSVTLGSMTSSGDAVSTSTGTSTNDSLPVVGGTDWNEQPDVSGALLTNPLRPIITAISDNTTLSERQVWVWLGIVFVAFITVLVGSRVRGHHLITGIAAGAAISLMVVFTIFPILTLLVAALAIFGGMVSERSPSL